MSKENTDLYGDKIEKSTYTPTAEEIKKKEKQDKINQDLMIRKLKSEPKVDEVLKLKTNISPVETRLLTNQVEISKPDYNKNDIVVSKVRLNNVQTYFKHLLLCQAVFSFQTNSNLRTQAICKHSPMKNFSVIS